MNKIARSFRTTDSFFVVLSFVMLQSGTTGNPKGVMLSHDNVSSKLIISDMIY